MRVLITGSDGFIGKNLTTHIDQLQEFEILTFTRSDSLKSLQNKVNKSDVIVHLAGENRPKDINEFEVSNVQLTNEICNSVKLSKKKIPIFFSSSIHAQLSDNPDDSNTNSSYSRSKKDAETLLENFSESNNSPIIIYRLPGVFGKWCKPDYNSVVATFCNNIANDIPITINDSNITLNLVHIDDLVNQIILDIKELQQGLVFKKTNNVFSITVGELFNTLNEFKKSRSSLIISDVAEGINRSLYSTYISYLRPKNFCYTTTTHKDERGVFVEMLKTKNSGQFSYFTSMPGVTRGEHYHHIKTEKFMILTGSAKFSFRNIITNEKYEINLYENDSQIIETAPGWAHKITNIGKESLVAIVWANENFNKDKPDTIFQKV